MPEAPEIRAMMLKLRRVLLKIGTIKDFIILGNKSLKLQKEIRRIIRPPFKLTDVECHGKFLYFQLDNGGRYLTQSSGLSGIWEFHKGSTIDEIKKSEKEIAAKVPIFAISGRGGTLIYFDQRHFSKFKIMNAAELETKIKKLGVDIINLGMKFNVNNVIFSSLAVSFKKKFSKMTIAAALMKQSIIAGIGNKLKSEVLYRAKEYPGRKVSFLSIDKIKKIIVIAAKLSVIYFEIQKRKSKMNEMYYKDDEERVMVYNKDKDKFGNSVTAAEFEDGRTTYFVKKIQK